MNRQQCLELCDLITTVLSAVILVYAYINEMLLLWVLIPCLISLVTGLILIYKWE